MSDEKPVAAKPDLRLEKPRNPAWIERLSPDELLDALGPAWSEMSEQQRIDYGPLGQ